jgi:DNA repair exonuclease SbcCD ATPase subunit
LANALPPEGAGIDSWEESFDSWTPRRRGEAPDETGADLDRAELLRLARELAETRHASREQASSELERLKQSLRERAEAIAARELELAELERRSGGDRTKKSAGGSTEAIAARERAALGRAQALEARERKLEAKATRLAADRARVAEREHELTARLAEAEARTSEAAAERELATAERKLLDERERATRAVEKELASLRVQLERERAHAGAPADAGAPEGAGPLPARDSTLRRLEARLEAREHELGLMRERLESERNALLARERVLHRREAAETRLSFAAPPSPPSFSDGLASFTQGRSRS